MRIILGVSGGIAAYKAVALLRLLTEAGHSVRVIPTASALRFVGAATWEALSGKPVTTDVFADVDQVQHVRLGQEADLVLVAPATADFLSRMASGRADDLLTATVLTARCPVVVAPAMHTEMWEHPATVRNVASLKADGVLIIEPDVGRLTGPDSGPGRLPEPGVIARYALEVLESQAGADVPMPDAQPDMPGLDMQGLQVLITAGGTREPLDPVRWIGNLSTGKQGLALASTALQRGAQVTLVAAHIDPRDIEEALHGLPGLRVIQVGTAMQMHRQVHHLASDSDMVVMAAAVADFRPAQASAVKMKKTPSTPSMTIELVKNPDILAELTDNRSRPGQVIVGFAAETGDGHLSVLDLGRDKAIRKKADLLAVNAVGENAQGHMQAFGTADNEVWLLDSQGQQRGHAAGSKQEVAQAIWNAALAISSHSQRRPAPVTDTKGSN